MQPEDYTPLLRNPRLKRVAAYFGSDKKNKRFDELLKEYNIKTTHEWKGFEFI